MKKILTILIIISLIGGIYLYKVNIAKATWLTGWDYRVKITVLAAKVDADLTDYPVYVDLSDLPAGFHTNVNQTDARDIRVTTDDGTTEVPREVVFYTAGDDTGELHFKGNILNETNVDFYIYYGNSGASDYAVNAEFGAENVWKAAYKGVWHMSEASGTVYDSTDNSTDSTSETLTTQGTATSIFGTSSDFDGTDDVIEFGDVLDLGTNDLTISAWVYLDTAGANDFYLSKARAAGQDWRYGAGVLNTTYVARAFMFGSGGSDALPACSTDLRGAWFYLTTTFDRSGNVITYTNAGDTDTVDISGWDGGNFQSDNPFRIGSYTAADNTATLNEFNGRMDEVRIMWEVLTATWISTEYNNGSDTSTFYSVGEAESGETALRVAIKGGRLKLKGGRLQIK